MSSSTSKFKSTPTYTFKGRTASITKNNQPNQFPSPNQYNPQKRSLKNSPEPKFAQSKRLQWTQMKSKQLSPGPGSHELPSYITNGQKRSINKTRFKQIKNDNPSPGEYNNDSFILKKKDPSFTFQKRTISTHDLIASHNIYQPSPVSYQQPLTKYTSTSINFAKALRPANISPTKTPGPGSYDPAESFNTSIISSSSKCKISKQKRKIDFSLGQRSPGPCTYQKKAFMDQFQKKSFSLRNRNKLRNHLDKIPGPGKYETPIFNRHKSMPHITIPLSLRSATIEKTAQINRNNPGPGSHELNLKYLPKFRSMSVHKFSKAPTVHYSNNRRNSSASLGPGDYENSKFCLNKHKSQPKFSIDSKTKRGLFLRKLQAEPGPTKYNPNPQITKRSEYIHQIAKSSRPNMIKHLSGNPGPGSYNFQTNQSSGRQFKFTKDIRKNYLDEKLRKQKSAINESYSGRQQFPNPPKYMAVSPKIKFNESKINKYI